MLLFLVIIFIVGSRFGRSIASLRKTSTFNGKDEDRSVKSELLVAKPGEGTLSRTSTYKVDRYLNTDAPRRTINYVDDTRSETYCMTELNKQPNRGDQTQED